MLYTHAQQNLGPAGVGVCLVHERLLARCPEDLPSMLDYRNHVRMRSAYNTPPVFARYVALLVTRWLRDEVGGLAAMAAINRRKAGLVYDVLDDASGFYRGRARRADRSLMNVPFRLPTAAPEGRFRQECVLAV